MPVRSLCGALLLSALALRAAPAQAHFELQAPASWRPQDALGSPQKLGPCGDEAGGAPTGLVTAFAPGQQIDVTIDERIFHPGHYRIALSVLDRSELPAEPPVTPGSTDCGTAPVQDPPVFPVLADGVFLHTQAFSGPQTVRLTLPAGVTCTACTLQVIEFMSDHALNVPGGCFYHHCADLSIQVGTVTPPAGPGAPGGVPGGSPSSGGGCSTTHGAPGLAVLLLVGGLALRRRRRARGGAPGAR